MIAARRDDVRDLNDRARTLLRSRKGLGRDELEMGDRTFAVGDRVVGRRNDRALGILNGQRGTVRGMDPARRTIEVDLDDGKRVALSRDYLCAGHLDHGYAITAHRAQGATVDRAFVLGSDGLYREWGYTALSRHRDEARFYVTRGDLEVDRELPPEADPVVAGLERLLGRSRVKELAHDGLADAPAEEIHRECDGLRRALASDPPPLPNADRLAHELKRIHDDLQSARRREASLLERRQELRWFDRGARAQLNAHLAIAGQEVQRLARRYADAGIEHATAREREDSWLREHGDDAGRLLAVDHELRQRERTDRAVTRRLDGLAHPLDPLDRTVELPARDIGGDLSRGL